MSESDESRSKALSIQVTPTTHSRLKALAKEREWSVSQTANKLLVEGLDRAKKDDEEEDSP